MTDEHHVRVLGMALLLGDIPFSALAETLGLPGAPSGAESLEGLLDTLQQRGLITAERRLELHARVADLERTILGAPSRPEEELTSHSHGASPTEVVSISEAEADVQRTLSWTRPSHTRPAEDPNLSLLSALTLPRWNTFINLSFIGEGGMGRIFRAFDPELNRPVALKFLRWVDRTGAADLIREARSQAQVDHPNICKVFEVKEWHGQVYLVMQFIEGRTLDQVAPLMTLAQKVELMERVADAVHAAHRQGLIHRDLKPTNIMVKQEGPDTFTPYVLDFGLARDAANDRQTRQGAILGTAHYMAPEQARGDTDQIERRTDVYALGVTLYEILTGAPPFADIKGMDCLRHIQEVPPPPLRTRNPELPEDLQTIVMKCLEKEIPLRYGSARALGEDLRRFRDHEPIHARPATLGYRLGKYARKNKAVVLIGLAALLAVLVLAGFGIQARVSAASLAFWAQHYGQEAERIEALLRYVRLQPPHDVRPEMARVQARIQSMEQDLAKARRRAQGPGRYALGRACLALGEPDRALEHLDWAWRSGFQSPDVAYSRGRALGQVYARALEDARTLQDERLRQARIQELEERLRAPAVALLRQGQGSLLDPPGFQEGLLAFYDRDFSGSLRLARSAAAGAPWFYEARRLEGEILLEQARLARNPGQALAFLDQAGSALAEAARTAPSDPSLWDLLTRRWGDEMVIRRRSGQSIQAALGNLEEACAHWQRLVPDSPTPEARLAKGELESARGSRREAGEPDALARALDRCEALRVRHPDDPETLGALASALQLRAYRNLNLGQDPRPDLERAVGLLRRAFEARPNAFDLCQPLVACAWALVEFEKGRGRNPEARVREARLVIQDLARRFPGIPDFQGYLGGLLVELADFQATHGIDPGPVARQALGHLDRASGMAPARFEFHFSRGNAHLAVAQFQVLQGQDPEPALAAAETAYRASLGCNPSARGARLGLGEAALLRAQTMDARRLNPIPLLSQAEAGLQAIPPSTGGWRALLFAAQVARLRAHWVGEPSAAVVLLNQAESSAQRALREGGRTSETLLVLAQVHRSQARLRPTAGPERERRAQRLVEELLQRDPLFEPARRLSRRTEAPHSP